VDVGVGQGSALSSILSVLFISPIFHIFKKRVKNLEISISFLLFVDGLFISQEKSLDKTNANLFYRYNIIPFILEQFGLVVEYGKTKVFPGRITSLTLSYIRGPILQPKDSWNYLRFIFDRKFTLHQHIKLYTNKALFIVKYMKILGNLMYKLLSY